MTSPAPRLVTVAHGTRHAPGNEVARAVTERAGQLLGTSATTAYVELCEPLLTSVMEQSTGPSVVVPLLLSTGFHVTTDVPEAAALSPHPVQVAPALGPHPLLAAAQASRLVAAGARAGQPVVLVAAGSTDPASDADLARAVELLAAAWSGPVELATLSGRGRRPAEVVRRGVAVSPYLLSPGFFSRRAREESLEAGAALVADVIGPHRFVADLVVRRFRALQAALAA